MRPTSHHLAIILAVLVLGCTPTDDEPVIDDGPPSDGSEATANGDPEVERGSAEEDAEVDDDGSDDDVNADPGESPDQDPPTDRSEGTDETTDGTGSKTERPERSDTQLDDPPRVTIHLDGAASSMARGGSCWTDTAGDEVCGDPFGIVTGTDVHAVSAGAQLQLALEPDIAPTRVEVVLLTPTADAEQRGNRLVWPGTQVAHELGTSSLGPHRIEASPGHYLLQARLRFEQGSADYGVQLEVR